MTDKEKLDKFVAEIERLKKIVDDPILSDNDLIIGERNTYMRLLSFYDSMQKESQVKESAKIQHVKETCKENGNSLTQKSETIDFEQELYKYFGQVKDFTLGMRIAKRFYEIGRNHQESVTDDLDAAIDTYLATYFCGEKEKQDWPFLKKMAIHFANWQKEQMVEKAVETTFNVSLPCSVYDKLKAKGCKDGDKLLIVIKED